jgi:hypothetical protein
VHLVLLSLFIVLDIYRFVRLVCYEFTLVFIVIDLCLINIVCMRNSKVCYHGNHRQLGILDVSLLALREDLCVFLLSFCPGQSVNPIIILQAQIFSFIIRISSLISSNNSNFKL